MTKQGQTVIPMPIREHYHIAEGDHLIRLDDGEAIKIIPVPADPIRALRGCGRGEQLVQRLLQARYKGYPSASPSEAP